ncbi:MAG: MtrAB system histidine kinase MtrB [Micrococcaceae bacterium]
MSKAIDALKQTPVLRRVNSSLQLKTVLIIFLLSLLSLAVVGNYIGSKIADNLFSDRLNQALGESKRTTNDFVSRVDLLKNPDKQTLQSQVNEIISSIQNPSVEATRWFSLYLPPGQKDSWLATTSSNGFDPSKIPTDLHEQVSTGNGQYWKVETLDDGQGMKRPALLVGSQIQLPPGINYELYFIYDLTPQQNTMNSIKTSLHVAGLMLLCLFSAVAYLVIRRVIRPVKDASHIAEDVAAGDYSKRVEITGDDEIAKLGTSFNKMTGTLADKIKALEQLSKVQQSFVSDVSHELRTPLTTINMASTLLYSKRDTFDAAEKRSVELLHNQVERFEELLAELLEISRFDAGAAVLTRTQHSLLEIVEKTRVDIQSIIESNKTRVDIYTDGFDITAEIDTRRITRIIRNLMVNAVDYSEAKPVSVFLAANTQAVSVAVADQGAGMKQEHLERVFDRFWRADSSRVRTTGGTGLGLTISKEDAQLHHGTLVVDAQEGKGSTFVLSVPKSETVTLKEEPLKPLPANQLLECRQWVKHD